jgi:hypothetical protein
VENDDRVDDARNDLNNLGEILSPAELAADVPPELKERAEQFRQCAPIHPLFHNNPILIDYSSENSPSTLTI